MATIVAAARVKADIERFRQGPGTRRGSEEAEVLSCQH
jgi:hypothetical protein